MLEEKRRLAEGLDDFAKQSLEDEKEEAVALDTAGATLPATPDLVFWIISCLRA